MTRRTALLATLAGPVFARAAPAAPRRLAFDVWRGGNKIGRHTLAFDGGPSDFRIAIEADIAVGLGPITLFRYRHEAFETWRGGRFVELISHTITNGKAEQLSAVTAADGVWVRTPRGSQRLAPGALPLTHWNERAFSEPLFNPQTGALIRVSLSRQPLQTLRWRDRPAIEATRYTLTGDTNLVDWYDASEVWCALSARATDGSRIDYRQAAT